MPADPRRLRQLSNCFSRSIERQLLANPGAPNSQHKDHCVASCFLGPAQLGSGSITDVLLLWVASGRQPTPAGLRETSSTRKVTDKRLPITAMKQYDDRSTPANSAACLCCRHSPLLM